MSTGALSSSPLLSYPQVNTTAEMERKLVECSMKLDSDSHNPILWYERGRVLYELKRLDCASFDFDRALELIPTSNLSEKEKHELSFQVRDICTDLHLLAKMPAKARSIVMSQIIDEFSYKSQHELDIDMMSLITKPLEPRLVYLKERFAMCSEMMKNQGGSSEGSPGLIPDEGIFQLNDPHRTSDANIRMLNEELAGLQGSNHLVEIKKTCLGGLEQFSVIAKKSIRGGQLLLAEKTPICELNWLETRESRCAHCLKPSLLSIHCRRCQSGYCSKECFKEALESYHLVICPKMDTEDFKEMQIAAYESRTGLALVNPVVLRVYAMAKTRGVSPLELPETKFLIGASMGPPAIVWNPYNDRCFERILRIIGESIYQPTGPWNYWTFKTLMSRIQVNGFSEHEDVNFEKTPHAMISLTRADFKFTSFFNHSCEPNASMSYNGNEIKVRAIKTIKAREEITLMYLSDFARVKKYERQVRLLTTFGFVCKCKRCLREPGKAMVWKEFRDQLSIIQ